MITRPPWPAIVKEPVFRVGDGLALIKLVVIVVARRCEARGLRIDCDAMRNDPIVKPGSASNDFISVSTNHAPYQVIRDLCADQVVDGLTFRGFPPRRRAGRALCATTASLVPVFVETEAAIRSALATS